MASNTKLISISGGSGSGKTTAARMLQQMLNDEFSSLNKTCLIVSQDNYYKDQSKNFKGDGSINFDHPNAIDFALLEKHLSDILEGKEIDVPIYDFVTHSRKSETQHIKNADFIIIDGTHILYSESLRKLFNYSLFLDIPEDIRFARRLKRDVQERGRTPEGVQVQFYNLVKPMHELYIEPLKFYAQYIAHNDHEVKDSVSKLFQQLRDNMV
jgi:uridine kinase